jgi:hypothetical protein
MRKRKKNGHQMRRQIARANAEMDRETGGRRVIALGPIEIGHGAYRLHAGAGRHSGKSIHDIATKPDGLRRLVRLIQNGRLKADDQMAVLAYLRAGEAGGGAPSAVRANATEHATLPNVPTRKPEP